MLLLDAAHHHAEMAGFDDYAYALRVDGFLNRLGDLRGETFLDLQTPRENFDQPRNLAQTNYFALRDVGDVNFAKKGQQVVLAKAEHLDVFHDHHFVVADSEKGFLQQCVRVFLVALGKELQCAVHTVRRAGQAFAGRVFTQADEHFFDKFFKAGTGYGGYGFDWCHAVPFCGRVGQPRAASSGQVRTPAPTYTSGGFRNRLRIRTSSSWSLPCLPFPDERAGSHAAKYRR